MIALIDNKIIKRSFLASLLFGMLFFAGNCNAQNWDATYQSMVIVKIQNINNDQYSDVITEINKDSKMSFEYACRETGIVVVKIFHNHNQKSDVQSFVMPKFKKWAKNQNIQLIYIDLKEGSSGKC